jgi:hypothetical protein
MWELLRRSKKGRTIILTTHYMDEADLLGDRIAIMAHGKVRCAGSSLFLKTRSGIGYTLTLVKSEPHCSVQSVDALIAPFVPQRKVLSTAGGEMSFRLPLECAGQFSAMFAELEKQRATLGVGGYGIAMTTLEEVFLRLSTSEVMSGGSASVSASGSVSASHEHDVKVDVPVADKSVNSDGTHNGAVDANKPLLMHDVAASDEPEMEAGALRKQRRDASFALQLTELLRKRYLCALRDLNGRFFEIILPVCVVALTLLILKLNISPAVGNQSLLWFFPHSLLALFVVCFRVPPSLSTPICTTSLPLCRATFGRAFPSRRLCTMLTCSNAWSRALRATSSKGRRCKWCPLTSPLRWSTHMSCLTRRRRYATETGRVCVPSCCRSLTWSCVSVRHSTRATDTVRTL